jgi:hypothetical protein
MGVELECVSELDAVSRLLSPTLSNSGILLDTATYITGSDNCIMNTKQMIPNREYHVKLERFSPSNLFSEIDCSLNPTWTMTQRAAHKILAVIARCSSRTHSVAELYAQYESYISASVIWTE